VLLLPDKDIFFVFFFFSKYFFLAMGIRTKSRENERELDVRDGEVQLDGE
jgi:hypothetical protein